MQVLPENASTWPPNDWRLTVWLSFGVLAACAAAAGLAGDPADGARMVIGLTARTSLILFVLAFTASSLARLWPSTMPRWLRATAVFRSRLRFLTWDPCRSHLRAVGTRSGAVRRADGARRLHRRRHRLCCHRAEAVISFDRTAAAIGPKAWHVIHTGGTCFLPFFFVNFGRRAVLMPEMYWPYMALIIAAIALRLIVRLRGRKRDAARLGASRRFVYFTDCCRSDAASCAEI